MTPEARQVLDRLIAEVREATGLDARQDRGVMGRLEAAAVRAAEDIGRFGRAAVTLPALVDAEGGPYHLSITVFGRSRKEGRA